MEDEMKQGLSEANAGEKENEATYGALMAAKKKELKAATKMIEEKLQLVGQLATEIENMKNELEDTKERLAEDSKMIATLAKQCQTKEGEYKKSQALRQEEQVALADTIKILNDDDALDLFKKTLPSASSFLQVQVTTSSMQRRALALLKSSRKGHRHA